MGNDLFKFEELKVYQKSLDFIDSVYQITKSFPTTEIYGLTSQFKRASQSIALNIAEGCGNSPNQFIRYLNISRGSIRECIVCISIAIRQNYINSEIEKELRISLIELSKMLSGLISSIQLNHKNK